MMESRLKVSVRAREISERAGGQEVNAWVRIKQGVKGCYLHELRWIELDVEMGFFYECC